MFVYEEMSEIGLRHSSARLSQARVHTTNMQREFERAESMFDKGLTSESQLAVRASYQRFLA